MGWEKPSPPHVAFAITSVVVVESKDTIFLSLSCVFSLSDFPLGSITSCVCLMFIGWLIMVHEITGALKMFSHTREHSSYSLTDKETEDIQEELSWGVFAHCKQLLTVVFTHIPGMQICSGPKWDQGYWGTFYAWQGAELQIWTNQVAPSRAIGMELSICGENVVSLFNIFYTNLLWRPVQVHFVIH